MLERCIGVVRRLLAHRLLLSATCMYACWLPGDTWYACDILLNH